MCFSTKDPKTLKVKIKLNTKEDKRSGNKTKFKLWTCNAHFVSWVTVNAQLTNTFWYLPVPLRFQRTGYDVTIQWCSVTRRVTMGTYHLTRITRLSEKKFIFEWRLNQAWNQALSMGFRPLTTDMAVLHHYMKPYTHTSMYYICWNDTHVLYSV